MIQFSVYQMFWLSEVIYFNNNLIKNCSLFTLVVQFFHFSLILAVVKTLYYYIFLIPWKLVYFTFLASSLSFHYSYQDRVSLFASCKKFYNLIRCYLLNNFLVTNYHLLAFLKLICQTNCSYSAKLFWTSLKIINIELK